MARDPQHPENTRSLTHLFKWVGLGLGPVLALVAWWLLPQASETSPAGLSPEGRAVAALAILMACWWITEAIPLSATALLPLVLLPLLQVRSIGEASAPYADKVIFLFLGGFILGLSMERWGLHRRIALVTILLVGTRPRSIIAGFMLATAVMSMWISNTATAIMMMPIAASVIGLVRSRVGGAPAPMPGEPRPNPRQDPVHAFALCTLLAIAWSASIGGLGTLIGTPPNTLMKGFIERTYGVQIGFVEWMRLGVPLVAMLLPLAYLLLTRAVYPIRLPPIEGGRELIRSQLRELGPMRSGELITMAVFFAAALSWITRGALVQIPGLGGLTDEGIAVAAALALFILPVSLRSGARVMDWETAERLPWGILILFGGGLSLASAMSATGVDRYIGGLFEGLGGLPTILVVGVVVCAVLFLTEVTSNTAVTNALLPVLAGAAAGMGTHPFVLIIPAALAASCAFMLPVGTPPNAIVFSTGDLTIPEMAKAGFWMNLVSVLVITLVGTFLMGLLLGVDLSGSLPLLP